MDEFDQEHDTTDSKTGRYELVPNTWRNLKEYPKLRHGQD